MNTWEEALRLRGLAQAALSAAAVDAVVVLDGADAYTNLMAGVDVLLVTMPRTERTGTALEVQTWNLYAICATSDDVTEYWPRLDALTDALAEPLEVETIESRTWVTGGGNEFPSIQYTLTT